MGPTTSTTDLFTLLQMLCIIFTLTSCKIDCPVAVEENQSFLATCIVEGKSYTAINCEMDMLNANGSPYQDKGTVTYKRNRSGYNWCARVIGIPSVDARHRNLVVTCTPRETFSGKIRPDLSSNCSIQVFRQPNSLTCIVQTIGTTGLRIKCDSIFIYPGIRCNITYEYRHNGNRETGYLGPEYFSYSEPEFKFNGAKYYNASCSVEWYPKRRGRYNITTAVSFDFTGGQERNIRTRVLDEKQITNLVSLQLEHLKNDTLDQEDTDGLPVLNCTARGFEKPPLFRWYVGNTFVNNQSAHTENGSRNYQTFSSVFHLSKTSLLDNVSSGKVVVSCAIYPRHGKTPVRTATETLNLPQKLIYELHKANKEAESNQRVTIVILMVVLIVCISMGGGIGMLILYKWTRTTPKEPQPNLTQSHLYVSVTDSRSYLSDSLPTDYYSSGTVLDRWTDTNPESATLLPDRRSMGSEVYYDPDQNQIRVGVSEISSITFSCDSFTTDTAPPATDRLSCHPYSNVDIDTGYTEIS